MSLDQDAKQTPPGAEEGVLGERALRTRNAILDASRRLFLERGYSGMSVPV